MELKNLEQGLIRLRQQNIIIKYDMIIADEV
jgi:hypothetical protein